MVEFRIPDNIHHNDTHNNSHNDNNDYQDDILNLANGHRAASVRYEKLVDGIVVVDSVGKPLFMSPDNFQRVIFVLSFSSSLSHTFLL
jgi:predicted transcriptional regulator